DLLGALREVLGGVGTVVEEAGGLDHDVDAELAPWQRSGVALGEHLDLDAVDADRGALGLDRARGGAEDRVVLEQVRERARVRQVVDGHPLDVRTLCGPPRLGGTQDVPADPAESVDPHAYGHSLPPGAKMKDAGHRSHCPTARPTGEASRPACRGGYQRAVCRVLCLST